MTGIKRDATDIHSRKFMTMDSSRQRAGRTKKIVHELGSLIPTGCLSFSNLISARMNRIPLERIQRQNCTPLISRLKICVKLTISHHKRMKRHGTHFNYIQKTIGILWKSPIFRRPRLALDAQHLLSVMEMSDRILLTTNGTRKRNRHHRKRCPKTRCLVWRAPLRTLISGCNMPGRPVISALAHSSPWTRVGRQIIHLQSNILLGTNKAIPVYGAFHSPRVY